MFWHGFWAKFRVVLMFRVCVSGMGLGLGLCFGHGFRPLSCVSGMGFDFGLCFDLIFLLFFLFFFTGFDGHWLQWRGYGYAVISMALMVVVF